MNALMQKMAWLDSRQKVLAQNIANADTPGYQPQDLQQLQFKELLESSTSKLSLGASSVPPPSLTATNPGHLGLQGRTAGKAFTERDQKSPYEVAPAGNAVVLEEQLLKMNQNVADHSFVSNLYQKNIFMLKAALKTQ